MAGPTTSGWRVGAVVGGAHHLLEHAEERGVIAMWRAEDVRRPGRALALTPLPPGAGAPAFVRAPHPDVIALTEVRAHEGGRYAVAPWAEGVTLERWLDGFEHRRPPTRIAWRAFARLCALVETVHHARETTAHGWISPRSLVVTGDAMDTGDRMTLLDLGLAELGARPAWRRSDGVEAWAWTSPEQARGAGPSTRGDVFSLAVIMAELLTGHPLAVPHEGTAWWQLAETGEAAVLARLRALRPELMGAPIDLVAQALSGDPERRLPDAAAFRKALRGAGVKLAVERAGTAVLRRPHEPEVEARRPRVEETPRKAAETERAQPAWEATTPELVSHFEAVFAAEPEVVTEPTEVREAPSAVTAPQGDLFAASEEPVTTPIERGWAKVPEAFEPTMERTAPLPPPAHTPLAPTTPMVTQAPVVLPAVLSTPVVRASEAPRRPAEQAEGEEGPPVWVFAAVAALLAVVVAGAVYGMLR